MEGKFIIVIVCAVLGGLVMILAAIYAYIYFTRIRPHHRFTTEDRYTRPVQQMTGQTENEDNKRLFQPFLILSYANRMRRENNMADDKM